MASVSGYNKIVLRGSYSEGGSEHEEGFLTSAAYPGMNMVLSQAAESQQIHSYTPGGTDYAGTGTNVTTTKGPVRILKEDALQGNTVDDVYASGDIGFIYHAKNGDILQVLVASGETIVKGDGLTAGTDGKWVGDTTNAAVEALESSGLLSADTLVRVRVL